MYIFPKKISMRKMALFYIFANFFAVLLNEDSQVLILLLYYSVAVCLFWLKYVKRIQSHTDNVV